MTIFIGGAWPYANGSLHLGHVASLLPGDILARYYRLKGEEVLYVSGSDCHGTPIAIRADQEGVSPKDIVDRYHAEFDTCFRRLGFSYDLYSRTDAPFHHQVVQEVFLKLLEKGYLYKKTVQQTFCPTCDRFLPDRYVEGTCPHCNNIARGDQCDFCSAILDPTDLHDKQCKLCGSSPIVRDTDHFFLALSRLQKELSDYVHNAEGWRENAVHLSQRYLSEGLHDRAVTRDLPWGIDVPIEGYEGKKIYVWMEAVLGYLSASKKWAEQTGKDWSLYWSHETKAYYVHGKDNIPFHTLILPALLLGIGDLHLPDRIVSNEYLTLEGKKISTSRNWAVWVPYIIDRYHPDSIRYFLTINAPEKRDADFSWREFINSHNGELLGAFGNFVNRSLVFVEKSFGGRVPEAEADETMQGQILDLYFRIGSQIEAGAFKEGLESVFRFIREANKYFDDQKPWIQVKSDPHSCAKTLYTCVQIIANLSNLLAPFLPFTCEKIRSLLGIKAPWWGYVSIDPLTKIKEPEVLYKRIDPKLVEEEVNRLGVAPS